jgi:hypothetical protein
VIYNLYCPVLDVVYPLHPQHLILCLELFGDALTLGYLLYQQEHLLRRLFVYVCQIGIQSAAGQKLRVQGFALGLDEPQVSLSPNADGPFILNRYCQAGNVIIAPQLVPQTVAFIKKILAEL